MNGRRLAAVALIGLALAPGTFLRTDIPRKLTTDLAIESVTDLPERATGSGFTREGAWQLTSSSLEFGGYSAILAMDDASLRLFSDRGNRLTLPAPGRPLGGNVTFASDWDRGELSATVPDIEAATRDPASGDYWLAFENTHSVIRFNAANGLEAARLPPEWQGWPENSGAEAMTRLSDGRFLVLPERSLTGLIYPSDPTGEVEARSFAVALPAGYHPTDAAALPDGRVLVLLRKLERALPPFSSAIGIADPAALDEGDVLDVDLLLRLEAILPRENYEGLAVADTAEDGTVYLWLVSDDNLSMFQRTLLVRLGWQADVHEKARGD